jgi:hypothetical protein
LFAAFLIILVGIALTLDAWLRFEGSASRYPAYPEVSDISINDYYNQSLASTETQTILFWNYADELHIGLNIHLKRSSNACIRILITSKSLSRPQRNPAIGAFRIKDGREVVALKQNGFKLWYTPKAWEASLCPSTGLSNVYRTENLIVRFKKPLINVAGYRASLSLPRLKFGAGYRTRRFDVRESYDVWNSPSGMRMDQVNPESTSGIKPAWRMREDTFTSDDEWPLSDSRSQPQALMTNMAGEAAANRSSFISAAELGLAGGLIPYAIELTISGFKRRRDGGDE